MITFFLLPCLHKLRNIKQNTQGLI